MKFPRPITQIHEIELSSQCNLACVYCPHPKMQREKQDMDYPTFERSLEIVEHYISEGTQGELALTGIGEALLNYDFIPFLAMARKLVGWNRLLSLSTNGIALTDDILQQMLPYKPVLFISLHRPEVAARAMERAKAKGFTVITNESFVTSAMNWVGDVQWHVSAPKMTCEYLRSGWAVIRADGRVGTCCWDAETDYSYIGSVWDEMGSWVTKPHAACQRCSLSVPNAVDIKEQVYG